MPHKIQRDNNGTCNFKWCINSSNIITNMGADARGLYTTIWKPKRKWPTVFQAKFGQLSSVQRSILPEISERGM